MKSRDKKELFTKDKSELLLQLTQMRGELSSLHVDLMAKKLKNVRVLSAKRREIAQVATVLRVKQLAARSTERKI